MDTNILFWNIGRRDLTELVVDVVDENDVDILILAESPISEVTLLEQLNREGWARYHLASRITDRFSVLMRFPQDSLRPVRDAGGLSFRHFSPPLGPDILLVLAHLPSKRFHSDDDQAMLCTRLIGYIEQVEEQLGHARTVVIGDFNMNPYETGLVSAAGFHAVSDRQIAGRRSRRVAGEERRFFYNPTWDLLGDRSQRPAGTYYYSTGTQVDLFWYAFDQVLLRPDLLPMFAPANLRLITAIGGRSLLNIKGIPDPKLASDHLPIQLTLAFQLEDRP